ncbi:MAG: hypothetical protein BZ137_03135 [Methanosphaera sp. rholeuAM130]|nr:MAG: hypothetical protein BZ137_03135 [Methanosphaera sp. rholeuAM130]
MNITYSDDIIDLIVHSSYGIPLVMQEIGDSIYWLCDESQHINLNIAINGIKNASKTIHDRYLNSIISDENYIKLLQIISRILTPIILLVLILMILKRS